MRHAGPSLHTHKKEKKTQQCGGRRRRDISCSALIDSRRSCAPSVRGVDNKLINERQASAAMRHRLHPVINLSIPLKRSTGHQSCVRVLLLPFLSPKSALLLLHPPPPPPPLICCIRVCTAINANRTERLSVGGNNQFK